MIIRRMRDSDIPTLRQMYEHGGFPYSFPDLKGPLMETVLVAVEEGNDVPIAAIAAERIVQAYLLMDWDMHPAAKMRIIRAFHEQLAIELRKRNYGCLEAFLPPEIAETFGKRLMRTFGWTRNWPSFGRAF